MDGINTHHKNRLQEYCQGNNLLSPVYQIKKEIGPPHIRQFQVVILDKFVIDTVSIQLKF